VISEKDLTKPGYSLIELPDIEQLVEEVWSDRNIMIDFSALVEWLTGALVKVWREATCYSG